MPLRLDDELHDVRDDDTNSDGPDRGGSPPEAHRVAPHEDPRLVARVACRERHLQPDFPRRSEQQRHSEQLDERYDGVPQRIPRCDDRAHRLNRHLIPRHRLATGRHPRAQRARDIQDIHCPPEVGHIEHRVELLL